MLHRGQGGLELRREAVPQALSNVPLAEMGGIVAEGVAITWAEGAR